jgi:hypothetical protein
MAWTLLGVKSKGLRVVSQFASELLDAFEQKIQTETLPVCDTSVKKTGVEYHLQAPSLQHSAAVPIYLIMPNTGLLGR